MARITVVLDDIVGLSHNSITGEPRPAKVAAICDLAGAGGVAILIKDGNFTSEYEKTVRSVKEVLGIPLALIIPPSDKAIEKTLDLAPSMAVLTDIASGDTDSVSRLQVANIIVAVGITPDLDQVKAAAKMKADYVAIDVMSFCTEKSLSARVDLLNTISKVAALAERLSIGVIAIGPMQMNDVIKLADIEQIEDFFIGHELIAKAILFGLEDAIAEFKAEVNRN